MLFELVNPSDPYTFKTDDSKVAEVVALLVGNGKMGLTDEKGEKYDTMILFLNEEQTETHLTETFGEGGLAGFVDANLKAVADALDSVMSFGFTERRTFELAMEAIETEERREEYRAKVHDKNRSSMNDFGTYAWKMAKQLRESI